MSKNVVFIVSVLDSGGLENYLLRFLINKAMDFNKIVVFCKSGKDGVLDSRYIEIPNVEIKKQKLRHTNISDHFKFYNYLKKNNFDAVCDFTGNFAALPLLTAKLVGIKNRLVFFRKDTNIFRETHLNLTFNSLLNKLLPRVSTQILSNSKSAFNFFFKDKWKNNPKYEVIYNGIDASKFLKTKENLREELNIPEDAFVVGHVGRYNAAKNHKTIIEVAVQLCKLDSNNYFLFCGKDTDVYLKDRVLKEGLENQIKLLGLRNDVVYVLNTLDCFYFPSLSEGQPNALIEALVAGLPFVASNIEPHKETVPEEYHTQLTEPNNAWAALQKIEEIKRNKTLANSLNISEWAIKSYNPEILYNKFYKKLIE